MLKLYLNQGTTTNIITTNIITTTTKITITPI